MRLRYLIAIIAILLTIALIVSCAKQVAEMNEVEEPEMVILPEDMKPVVEEKPIPVIERPVKEFSVSARQWTFEPTQIVVNQGDLVKLKLKTLDIQHGFQIREFGVEEALNPGEEVTVEFIANRKGTFTYRTHIISGRPSSGMFGQFIVR